MSETQAATPNRPPNSWTFIVLGYVTTIIAAILAVLLIRHYLDNRPLDLTGHTFDLATKSRALIEANRVPSANIEVIESARRESDTAIWWYYAMSVSLPPEVNARGLEQVLMDHWTRHNVIVKPIETAEGLRRISLALAGHEFATITLEGGAQAAAATQRDLSPACDRIATEAYQLLRRRLPPSTRFTQFPSEPRRDAAAKWSHTRFEIATDEIDEPDTLIENILANDLANRDIGVESDDGTIAIRYLDFMCASIDVVDAVQKPAEPAAPAPDTPVLPEESIELPEPVIEESMTEEVAPLEESSSVVVHDTPAEAIQPQVELAKIAPTKKPTIEIKRKKTPRVAIIVDDGGNNEAWDNAFLEMDSKLTLAILPFTPQGKRTAKRAADLGFELMLHMPMESDNESVTHPGIITTNMSKKEIIWRMENALKEVPGVAGVNNHTGSRFTSDLDALSIVMDVLKDQDLYFVDSLTSQKSAVGYAASAAGVPWTARDIFLDNEADAEYIEAQFDELIAKAEKRGWAVGICHFRPITAEAMPELLKRLEEEGIDLVHVSELLR